jgi:hypothetical protein
LSPRRNRIRAAAAALAASLLLAAALIRGQGNASQAGGEKVAPAGKAVAPRKPPAGGTSPAARRSSSVSRRTRTTHGAAKGKRRLSARQRRARLRLEPERVQEIQHALVQAGYLHEEATGRWDEPTRDAMRRYQTDHGFLVTGLPEAKSLMKLGLGPHPLPAEVDPSVTAQASAGQATKDAPSTGSPTPSRPSDAATPPKQ